MTKTDDARLASLIDCHNHLGVELLTYLRGEFPYAQHLSVLFEEGRRHGIGRFVVFPFVTNLSLDLGALREGKIEWPGGIERTPYKTENRRLLHEIHDLFPEKGRSMIPFVMVDPLRATEEQAREIESLREDYPFYGFKIQSTMLEAEIKALLDRGKVFLEMARAWDLPFLIHSSILPEDRWARASDILDIAEATPDVRFCLAHSCRFDRTQLDRLAAMPNAWFDCSAHCIHCDLAVSDSISIAPRDRRFSSDYTDPGRVLKDLAAAYPDKLMWGSDSPFYSFICKTKTDTFDLRSSYAREVEALAALDEQTRRRVASANTSRFLGGR